MRRLFVFMLVLAGLALGAFYFLAIKPSQEALRKAGESIAQGIESVFNTTPKVSINSTVVIEQARPILEVAVLSQQVYHDYFSTNTWMMSTKELHLKGYFLAKVGFDLSERGISVELNEAGDELYRVRVLLPAPKLLSFETEKYEVIKTENGWWNEITAQDLERAVNEMKDEARTKTLRHGILKDAKRTAQERIDRVVDDARGASLKFEIAYLWAEENLANPPPQADSLPALH